MHTGGGSFARISAWLTAASASYTHVFLCESWGAAEACICRYEMFGGLGRLLILIPFFVCLFVFSFLPFVF